MKKSTYKSDQSTDERVLMAMVRAAEIFKRVHSAIFKNYGLSFPQYNILRVLDASENGQNRISQVSQIMLVPSANMTGLAKRLEISGFLIRKPDPGDERVTILELTPKGVRTLENIEKEKDESLKMMMNGFSEAEKLEILANIKRILKNNPRIKS